MIDKPSAFSKCELYWLVWLFQSNFMVSTIVVTRVYLRNFVKFRFWVTETFKLFSCLRNLCCFEDSKKCELNKFERKTNLQINLWAKKMLVNATTGGTRRALLQNCDQNKFVSETYCWQTRQFGQATLLIVKTQLNHNQVEVGLTTLWVGTHPPSPGETLCCCCSS